MKPVCSTASSEPHVYHLLCVMCESFVMLSAFISHNWFISVIHNTHTHTYTNANEVTGTAASLFSCCRGRKAAEHHIHPLILNPRWRWRGADQVSGTEKTRPPARVMALFCQRRSTGMIRGHWGHFRLLLSDSQDFLQHCSLWKHILYPKWTRWQIHKHQVHKSSWSSSLYLC